MCPRVSGHLGFFCEMNRRGDSFWSHEISDAEKSLGEMLYTYTPFVLINSETSHFLRCWEGRFTRHQYKTGASTRPEREISDRNRYGHCIICSTQQRVSRSTVLEKTGDCKGNTGLAKHAQKHVLVSFEDVQVRN